MYIILVSNYHGCKGEAINLIPHYLIDIIHKTVKPSHLEKLIIMQNMEKLMFQVIFVFSEWILIKQIIGFSIPFSTLSKKSLRSFEWGTGACVKMHRLNAFARNVNTINSKNFSTHCGIYKLEKIRLTFEIKP